MRMAVDRGPVLGIPSDWSRSLLPLSFEVVANVPHEAGDRLAQDASALSATKDDSVRLFHVLTIAPAIRWHSKQNAEV